MLARWNISWVESCEQADGEKGEEREKRWEKGEESLGY
jgi:hypothetical protein